MANWQAPSTNNERNPDDVGLLVHALVRPYLDPVTGRVHWWTGGDALPGGATPYYMTIRAADSRRVLSTTNENEREPLLYGASTLYFR